MASSSLSCAASTALMSRRGVDELLEVMFVRQPDKIINASAPQNHEVTLERGSRLLRLPAIKEMKTPAREIASGCLSSDLRNQFPTIVAVPPSLLLRNVSTCPIGLAIALVLLPA